MPDQKHGYGPPSVESYTATMAEATPPQRAFAVGAQVPLVTITLHGQGFIERAMPLIVMIGDQAVVGGYHITADQCHLTFHLDRMPEDGAVIRVGYGASELVELPERFSRSKVQRGGGEVS